MKRDDDLIRRLLLEFEQHEHWLVALPIHSSMSDEELNRIGHVHLLCDAGLVKTFSKDVYRLTNQGHDFIAATRDEGLWQSTKDLVSKTGGNATLEIVKAVAVGLLKKKISQHTGIEL